MILTPAAYTALAIAAASPAQLQLRALHSGSAPLAMPVIAYVGAYGGGGGGGGGTSDPLVPADGTQNITGALSVSGAVTAGSAVINGSISWLTGSTLSDSAVGNAASFNLRDSGGIQHTNAIVLRSGVADGATGKAILLGANADATTTGYKIVSFARNLAAGGGGTEVLSVLQNGDIYFEQNASWYLKSYYGGSSVQLANSGNIYLNVPNSNNFYITSAGQLVNNSTLASATQMLSMVVSNNNAGAAAWEGIKIAVTDVGSGSSTSAAKFLKFLENGAERFNVDHVGAVTPGADISGANKLSWVGLGSYVIDFGAFTAGVCQTSAQTLTGVAFGDGFTVGLSADASANFGSVDAFVTSSGNIKISVCPISTVDTSNPASMTFTVKAYR